MKWLNKDFFFSCVLINQKGGGEKKKCCYNELCGALPTAGILTDCNVDQPKWLLLVQARRQGRMRVPTHILLAPRASRLCLPDTHWWLNGWVQDDDSAWRRCHAGQRWRADIRAGWFDGDIKDAQGLGPQTSCHWHGPGRADEMWVTAAQMHNILQPKSPWTLFSFKDSIYYKYCHKTRRAMDFFFLPVHELRDVFSWKHHPGVTMRQKPVPHAWRTVVTFHMAIIICCLLFVAISGKCSHTGINQELCLCAVRCK